MKNLFILSFLAVATFIASPSLEAYTQKGPYEGYGQPSKVNGIPKTKSISGYTKVTKNGVVRVNPYSRSRI